MKVSSSIAAKMQGEIDKSTIMMKDYIKILNC